MGTSCGGVNCACKRETRRTAARAAANTRTGRQHFTRGTRRSHHTTPTGNMRKAAAALLLARPLRQQQPQGLRGWAAAASTSSPGPPAAATQTLPCAPGTLVHVLLAQPGASLEVSNHPTSEEEVRLSATAGAALPDVLGGGDGDGGGGGGGRVINVIGRGGGAEAAAPATLGLELPSRFCGLSATTAGGAVRLRGQLQEAELSLATGGGSVSLKRVRATSAAIDSAAAAAAGGGGGSVDVGDLSAAHLRLSSGGGAVTAGRLAVLDADVVTAGGALRVGAMYGNMARVATSGAPLSVGHACFEGLLTLDSGGGPLTVDGLEGNASLISGTGGGCKGSGGGAAGAGSSKGGAVKLHLHERFGRVFVDSGGADVEAWVAPAARVALQVAADGGVALDPALKVSGEFGPTTLVGSTGGSGGSSGGASSGSGSATAGGSSGDQQQGQQQQLLIINAGGGAVRLRAVSWIDAVRAKVASGRGDSGGGKDGGGSSHECRAHK